MKNVLFVLAGIAWFGIVFVVSFVLTFPGEALIDRAKVEVQEGSDGEYALEIGELGPYWIGGAASGVKLYQNKARRYQEPDMQLALIVERVRAKVGLLGLLSGTARISGDVLVGGGDIDFVVGVGQNEKGTKTTITEIGLQTADFPIADLALITGQDMDGTGGIDVDIDITADGGMRKAEGKAEITATDVVITRIELPQVGDLGMEIPISELELELDVEEGRAEVKKGLLVAALATVEIEGDISLRDDLDRSTMNFQFTVSDVPEDQALIQMAVKSATWASDGKAHFECRGSFSRPTCSAASERSRRSSSSDRDPRSRTTRPTPGGYTPPTRVASEKGETEEDRERRREELRERLRQRRADREGTVPTRPTDGGDEEFDDDERLDDDEERFDDEDRFDDEELPFDDEGDLFED